MYEPRSAQLTYPVRKELVGKRFLVIEEAGLSRRGKNQNLESFNWKAGYIRACSVKDVSDKELQVLVEYDGANWEYRQWIKVYENTKAFLVENTIRWAPRTCCNSFGSRSPVPWPALTFEPVVDCLGISNEARCPIEFFGDKQMAFVRENELSQFKDGDERINQVFHMDGRVEDDLKAWQRLQKAQAFLMNGAVTLTGLRVTVYRLQLRQWYTGCITAHNLSTRELHVMDDNVLQTHAENPALVQINLLADDEELQRILHGKPLKVLPMRKHRHSQIFLQASGEGSKPQEGLANWHLLRELTVSPPQPGWNHPPVCHVINGSNGKTPFVTSAVKEWNDEKKPNISLPRQKCARRSRRASSAANEEAEFESSQNLPDEKPNGVLPHPSETQVGKPMVGVVAMTSPERTISSSPFPHYTQVISPSAKPKTPPRAQMVSPSPARNQHAHSPHSNLSRNEKTPPGNARTETPFRKQSAESETQLAQALSGDVQSLASSSDRGKSPSVACSPSGITSSKTSPNEKSMTHHMETPKEKSVARHIESQHKNNQLQSTISSSPTLTSPFFLKSSSNNENPERVSHEAVHSTVEATPKTLPHELSPQKGDTIGVKLLNLSKILQRSPPPELVTSTVAADQGQSSRFLHSNPTTVHDPNKTADRSRLCLHTKTIASVQLRDMMLQTEWAEYQMQLVGEALSTLEQTKSEEQYCFIADFYYNLLDESRRINNVCSDFSAKTLKQQWMEHRDHQPQLDSISLSYIGQSLPEEVKASLKAAKESCVKKTDEVMSLIRQNEQLPTKTKEKLAKLQKLHSEELGQDKQQNQQHLKRKPLQMQQLQKELQQQLQPQKQQQRQQQQQLLQQPNQLLKQLQQRLKGQVTKAREKSVLKTPASQGPTPEHSTRPQSKTQVKNVEAQLNYKEQLQRQRQNTIAPFLSAEQLLTHISSTPGLASLSYVADNLAMYSGSLIEDAVPSTSSKEHPDRELQKSEVSQGSDGLNRTKDVETNSRMELDSSANVTGINGPASKDSAVRRGAVVKSGPKEDNSGKSSVDNSIPRGGKRKASPSTSSGAESETASKPKRPRKSRQKKEKVLSESTGESPKSSSNRVSLANGFDVTAFTTSPASKSKNFDRTVLKAFPPGDVISSHDKLGKPDDRGLVPRKASVIDTKSDSTIGKNDSLVSPQGHPQTSQPDTQYFQPRSITKGIGFVPIRKTVEGPNANSGTTSISNPRTTLGGSAGSNVGSPLDVLASVSVWTSDKVQGKSKGKRELTEESTKSPKKRKDKPKKEKKTSKTKNSKGLETTKADAAKSKAIVMETREDLCLFGGKAVERTKSFGDGSVSTPSSQSGQGSLPTPRKQSGQGSIATPSNQSGKVTVSQEKSKLPELSSATSAELARTGSLSVVENIDSKFNVSPRNGEETTRLAQEEAKSPHSLTGERAKKDLPKTEGENVNGSFVDAGHQATEEVKKEAQGDEGKRRETNRKHVVFVNDQSIDSFVNAVNEKEEDDHDDNVFKKCLFDRRRQHSQRLNAKQKPENIEPEIVLSQPSLLAGHGDMKAVATAKSDQEPNKQANCDAKKELKVRKKKRNKEDLEVKEGKNMKVNILEVLVDSSSALTTGEVEEQSGGVPKSELGGVEEAKFSVLDGAVKKSEETRVRKSQDGGKEQTSKKKVKSKKKAKDLKPKGKENRSKENWSYFLQQGDCKSLPTMTPCRECRKNDEEESVMDKSCCRFDMFRRCRKKEDKVEVAGFSCPDNAQNEDLKPWIACENISEILTLEMSKYILKNVGDQFCNLVKQEKEAQSWSVKKDGIAWKRAVRGIREMCDACATTIFNVHWVCPKCGFGVCLDCFKSKLNPPNNPEAKQAKEYRWVRCSPNNSHRPQRLVLAQIIPQRTLSDVGDELHKAREFWGIGENCPCKGQIKALEAKPNEDVLEEKNPASETTSLTENIPETDISSVEVQPTNVDREPEKSPQKCDVEKTTEQVSGEEKNVNEEPTESEAAVKSAEEKMNTENENENGNENATVVNGDIGALSLLMDYESPVSSPATSLVEAMDCEESCEKTLAEEALVSRPSATCGQPSSEQEDYSSLIQPRITEDLPAPHSWICIRPMLRLHCAQHAGNLKSFQSRWEKGEPVLVSCVHKNMQGELWTPEGFAKEFGSEKADVVNCKTGGTIEKLDIGTFWRGFECVKDRPLDSKGEPTLLKLKDWPPEADFVEKMPTRFQDLNQALPLPEYTARNGSRNLVSRLPDFFVKPDLGPKMYNAYGNAAHKSAGTTNLHIDMSDAVNVMVYVGVPRDGEYGEQERRDSLSCVDIACDKVQQIRARDENERLGALWHIFAAEDANKIRALFHKVAEEKNLKYPINHDPIHDQCFYLDEPLLKRLKDEYDVVGWPIAQFLGDAVFIPAGAPHQVRNLHSCVKVAEDFVSPEHVGHCFKLTQEFRHLSDKHTNHEDKLQVKNIIYHAVKDAVSVLRRRERELESKCEKIEDKNV